MNFHKLNNLLYESVDVRVKDAKYENPMETVGDLSWYLNSKLGQILQSMTPEQRDYFYKNKPPEFVMADGPSDGQEDSYFMNKGILNIYLRGIPTEYHQKIKDAALYFLKDANVDHGAIITNTSKAFGGDTIRITINQMPKSVNNPPELNMSNGNAAHIFNNVLNLDQYDVGYGYVIPARELLMKIEMYNTELADMDARLPTNTVGSGGAKMISFGLDGDQIRYRLEKIRNIALWAIENDYDTIQVM